MSEKEEWGDDWGEGDEVRIDMPSDERSKVSAKHTPGPWEARRTPSRVPNVPDLWCIDWSKDQEEVAEIVHGEADARLISAAPDLLAALEKAVEHYGKPGGPWNVPSEPGTWIADARAAIAKAKGVEG